MKHVSEKAVVASMPDLTPLALHREGNHLKFVLRTPKDILAQLPDNYEQILAQRLANLLADETPLTVEINLAGLAGISSRQLGSLIALERVLRPRFGAVLMTNVSPTIRHVLEVTRTERLFKLS